MYEDEDWRGGQRSERVCESEWVECVLDQR